MVLLPTILKPIIVMLYLLTLSMTNLVSTFRGENMAKLSFGSPNAVISGRQTTLWFQSGRISFLKTRSFSFDSINWNRENKFVVSENGNRATFNCQVNPPFIGYAKPWIELDTGNTYCLFFPYSPEHLVHSMSTAKDMKHHVSVSVNASLKETRHVLGSASALLIGGFSITEPNKLSTNPDSNKTIISILGNTDVQIHWRNKGRLLISLIKEEGFGIAGRALYEVIVLRSAKFTDRILITLPATGQSAEIDVSYDTGESLVAPSKDGYSVLFMILRCVFVVIISVIILMKVIDRPGLVGPARTTTSVTNGAAAAPGTPERRSGAVIYHEESKNTITVYGVCEEHTR